jgi:hypothetical protein
VRLEAWFYRYAHRTAPAVAALRELENLLTSGARSPNWDLSGTVERAVSDGHPEPELLSALSGVIIGSMGLDALLEFKNWRSAVQAG